MPSTPRKSRRRAWTYALVGGLAVLAIAAAFVAVRSVSPSSSAQAESPSGGLDPDESAAVLAVLGDDLTDADDSWAATVASESDWALEDFTASGSGFGTRAEGEACTTAYCPDILDAVPFVVASDASAVIVAASEADASVPVDELRSRMESVLRALHVGLPQAVVIAVGPASGDPATAEALVVDGALRAAAEATGTEYVSLITPKLLTAEQFADGVPDAEARAAIADRVLTALRT